MKKLMMLMGNRSVFIAIGVAALFVCCVRAKEPPSITVENWTDLKDQVQTLPPLSA